MCRILALEMDFRFLLDPDKKLLSIGFSVATNRLDTNCYDLLASEARLASLFAIAKGDVETRHWFRLGRPATPIGSGSALISWSGSMFEYLMPSLVMRAPDGSVLEQTTRLIVARQTDYAAAGHSLGHLGIRLQRPRPGNDLSVFQLRRAGPWAEARPQREPRDRALCDGSGSDGRPGGRGRELRRTCRHWAEGRYGFYEAVDFTPSRLPSNENAGHRPQLHGAPPGHDDHRHRQHAADGRLRDRFHAEPMIQGAELLLQERIPRDVASAPPRATEVPVAPVEPLMPPPSARFEHPATNHRRRIFCPTATMA
jgi:cyclic beta-1,2-glucan synthetase